MALLSAFGGFVHPGCDDRVLPRVAVPAFRSLAHLELYLSGCLNWWYGLRGPRSSEPYHPAESVAGQLQLLGLDHAAGELR